MQESLDLGFLNGCRQLKSVCIGLSLIACVSEISAETARSRNESLWTCCLVLLAKLHVTSLTKLRFEISANRPPNLTGYQVVQVFQQCLQSLFWNILNVIHSAKPTLQVVEICITTSVPDFELVRTTILDQLSSELKVITEVLPWPIDRECHWYYPYYPVDTPY